MKIAFLIITIILLLLISYQLLKKKEQSACINLENYNLLRESIYTDKLCKYVITKEENQLRFSTKDNYTLFIIKRDTIDQQTSVTLLGLDGYGLRDKEFNKYICKLLIEIKEASLQN